MITLGIGSMLPRRWCRPLILIATKIGLLSTVLGGAAMGAVMYFQYDQLQASGLPVRSTLIAMALMVSVLALPQVALLVFFLPSATRDALAHFDPRPRWTDWINTPVLSVMVLNLLMGATLLLGLKSSVLAAGPWLLTGHVARGVLVVLAIAWLVAAWMCRGQRIAGWLATTVLVLLVSISWLVSALTGSGHQATLLMLGESNPDAAALLEKMQPVNIAMAVVLLVASILYLAWVRKFFVPDPAAMGVIPNPPETR
jgi:hypothetical protein